MKSLLFNKHRIGKRIIGRSIRLSKPWDGLFPWSGLLRSEEHIVWRYPDLKPIFQVAGRRICSTFDRRRLSDIGQYPHVLLGIFQQTESPFNLFARPEPFFSASGRLCLFPSGSLIVYDFLTNETKNGISTPIGTPMEVRNAVSYQSPA